MTSGGGGGGVGADPNAYGKAAGYSEDYGAPQAETSFQPEPGIYEPLCVSQICFNTM